MDKVCNKCGSAMEPGYTSGTFTGGLSNDQAKLLFIVRGVPTSPNPVKAFKQGTAEEPEDRAYRIEGYRCVTCGSLELFTAEQITAWYTPVATHPPKAD